MSYEPYPDDDGTMLRECKGCAGEYAIRTDDALESAGLVGEGCPWGSVSEMRRDLVRVLDLSEVYPEGTRNHRQRIAEAIALLSSGSNP